jgi:hypothetical protein
MIAFSAPRFYVLENAHKKREEGAGRGELA